MKLAPSVDPTPATPTMCHLRRLPRQPLHAGDRPGSSAGRDVGKSPSVAVWRCLATASSFHLFSPKGAAARRARRSSLRARRPALAGCSARPQLVGLGWQGDLRRDGRWMQTSIGVAHDPIVPPTFRIVGPMRQAVGGARTAPPLSHEHFALCVKNIFSDDSCLPQCRQLPVDTLHTRSAQLFPVLPSANKV